MGRHEKLAKKLNTTNVGFTYSELKALLSGFGYMETNKGKTSGSRVAFVHSATKHIIRLHKPHPGDQLKKYQIELLRQELRDKGLLK